MQKRRGIPVALHVGRGMHSKARFAAFKGNANLTPGAKTDSSSVMVKGIAGYRTHS